MTLPLLGTTEVMPFAAGNNPSHPAVCVLPDDTVLIAWQNLTTGLVTVRHYARDLASIIDEAATPGELEVGIWLRGMAMFPYGSGATLAVFNRTFTVSTGPLSITPTGTYADTNFAAGGASVVTLPDGATALAADKQVVIHRDGTLTKFTVPSVVASLYPGDGSTVYVGVAGASDQVILYRLDTAAGALSHVESGPVQVLSFEGIGRPGVYATLPDGVPLGSYGTGGDTIALTDWPDGSETAQQVSYVGTAPHPAGGWVSAWRSLNWITGMGHIGLANDTDTTLTVQELPHPNLLGLDTLAWSQAPVVATNGRTAVVVLTGYQDRFYTGAAADTYGITAWTVEVGQGGLLDVNTLDGWWTVGTRNPNMAYELLISTPLGWKVEIVAGEEHLATDELCVYAPHHEEAGEDGWVVCALMRPE